MVYSETAAEDRDGSGNSGLDRIHLALRGSCLCVRHGAGANQHGNRPAGCGGADYLLSAERPDPDGDCVSAQSIWFAESGALAAGADTESEICHSGFGLWLNTPPVLFYFPMKIGYTDNNENHTAAVCGQSFDRRVCMGEQLTPNSSMILEIRELLETTRKNVAQQVNTQMLTTYWNIGRIIVEYEQQNQLRAEYGKQTLRELSKELTREFGKGFSVSNIQFMRRFYQSYSIQQTVSVKLSWSHYCELLSITDENKRSFYEKEAVNSGWSVRELKRQIDSSLYERLLLSSGDANKEKVLSLAQKGIEISQPADIIRDPYVFEFLGVPEDKPMLESDLERALVAQIEKFLLELGRGFMFVGTQQRITLNNTHYYVDMVFYNKILRAYVLIELKTTKLTPEAAGQLNMYLNYYAAEVNDPDDNPPIGIILCTEKDSVAAEYALGGLSNNIFASRYVLYMPDKEQLIAQVEAVLKDWHEKKENGHD